MNTSSLISFILDLYISDAITKIMQLNVYRRRNGQMVHRLTPPAFVSAVLVLYGVMGDKRWMSEKYGRSSVGV